MQRNTRSIRGTARAVTGGFFCAVLILSATLAGASSVRDLTWSAQNSGATGTIFMLSGTSLDRFYFGDDADSTIRVYDAGTATWGALASWSAHVTSSANWNDTMKVSGVAAYGDKIYVARYHEETLRYAGYYDGTSWTDINLGAVYSVRSISLYDTGSGLQAVMAGANRTHRILDGTFQGGTNTSLGTLLSVSGEGQDYWLLGSAISGDSPAGNRVARSADGGVTWTQVTNLPGGGFTNAYALHAVDADRAIVATTSSQVFRTTDGGTTWVNMSMPSSGNVRGVWVNDWDDIIAYGTFANMRHWNGTNWATITLPGHVGETIRVVHKVGDYYWAAGNNGVMFTTIPEPSTLLMLVPAAGLIGVLRRRRRAAA